MFPKLLLLVINKTSKPQPELYLDFQIFTSVFLLDQFSTILSPHCIQVVNLDSPRSWKLKHSRGFLLSWLLTLWLPSTLLLQWDYFRAQLLQPPLLKEALGQPLTVPSPWPMAGLLLPRRVPDTSWWIIGLVLHTNVALHFIAAPGLSPRGQWSCLHRGWI